MPHVDELLGPATFAAAGLFAAIALQPAVTGAAPARVAPGVVSAPARLATVVQLPAVEVVARRGDSLEIAARDRSARSGT